MFTDQQKVLVINSAFTFPRASPVHRSPGTWPLAFPEVSEPQGSPTEQDRHRLRSDEDTQDGEVLD